jgi:hypothetical protein
MELAAMESNWDDIPEPRTAWRPGPAHTGGQYPAINGVALKGLLALAPGLFEAMLFAESFGLPALLEGEHEAHFTQLLIQVVFADLHRAKSGVPFPPFACFCHSLHIFHDHISKGQDRAQMGDDPGFGFPATTGGRRDALLAPESIVDAFGPTPHATPAYASHGPSGLDGLFDMCWGLDHQMKHRLFGTNHTEPLEGATRINANHQSLIIRVLFMAQLDKEQAQFIAPGISTPLFEQEASFGRVTGHEWHASAINHCDTHNILFLILLPVAGGRFEARTAKLSVIAQNSWSKPG